MSIRMSSKLNDASDEESNMMMLLCVYDGELMRLLFGKFDVDWMCGFLVINKYIVSKNVLEFIRFLTILLGDRYVITSWIIL